jgi:hypothetical protein
MVLDFILRGLVLSFFSEGWGCLADVGLLFGDHKVWDHLGDGVLKVVKIDALPLRYRGGTLRHTEGTTSPYSQF